jgi:hypothetical protein
VASQINISFVAQPPRALRWERPLSILNRCASWSLIAIVIAMAVGCSGSGSAVPPPTDSSMLRGIIRIYSTAARDLGRSPKNIDELKAVLAPVSKDPSEYLRSTRDGEEFAVVWGLNLATAPPDTVLAYERKGIDGKRMVVTVAGDLREVTPAEFAAIKFPKDYQPES